MLCDIGERFTDRGKSQHFHASMLDSFLNRSFHKKSLIISLPSLSLLLFFTQINDIRLGLNFVFKNENFKSKTSQRGEKKMFCMITVGRFGLTFTCKRVEFAFHCCGDSAEHIK